MAAHTSRPAASALLKTDPPYVMRHRGANCTSSGETTAAQGTKRRLLAIPLAAIVAFGIGAGISLIGAQRDGASETR